jgi:hypothetical protein
VCSLLPPAPQGIEEIFDPLVELKSGVNGPPLFSRSSMKLSILAALIIALMLLSVPAIAEEDAFRFVGEELYFSVRISGAEAMRAGIRIGQVQERDGRTFVPINGMARSRGLFDAVYPLDDRANTYVHPLTYFPIRSEKVFEEAGKRRTYFVDYRQQRFEADVERERDDRTTRFNAPIPGETHDMLSWLYHFRDNGPLSIGDEFSYYIYDGWLLSRVDLEVIGREELLTPMGWFMTWKIYFSREIMEVNRTYRSSSESPATPPDVSVREHARHTGHLWFSRDENLLPVQLTIPTMLGYGEAVLIRYQPATRGE